MSEWSHADPSPAPATCPGCGRPFGCGAATGSCWCAGVPLDDENRARLAGDHAGCLCPDCLVAASEAAELREPAE